MSDQAVRNQPIRKDHVISEDDERRALEEVQKVTDQHIATIDEMQKKEDGELLPAR